MEQSSLVWNYTLWIVKQGVSATNINGLECGSKGKHGKIQKNLWDKYPRSSAPLMASFPDHHGFGINKLNRNGSPFAVLSRICVCSSNYIGNAEMIPVSSCLPTEHTYSTLLHPSCLRNCFWNRTHSQRVYKSGCYTWSESPGKRTSLQKRKGNIGNGDEWIHESIGLTAVQFVAAIVAVHFGVAHNEQFVYARRVAFDFTFQATFEWEGTEKCEYTIDLIVTMKRNEWITFSFSLFPLKIKGNQIDPSSVTGNCREYMEQSKWLW